MGIMSLFGKGPMSEKQISKAAKLAANPFAQPDVRMREMHRLLQDGTPESYAGALRRFAANANGAIADEDEKKWLEDSIADVGESIIEPLRHYIRTEKQLTYALQAYERLTGAEETVRFDLEVLNHYGPEDHRSGEHKLQLVWHLAEHLESSEVLSGLCAFLLDHSDDVRWAVIDILERAADAEVLHDDVQAQASNLLGQLIADEDVGPRIQKRAAELLCVREWQVGKQTESLDSALEDTYFLDKKRYVRRRARPKSS